MQEVQTEVDESTTPKTTSLDVLDAAYLNTRGITTEYAVWEGLRSLPDIVNKAPLVEYGIGKVPCGGLLITYGQSSARGTYRLRLRHTEFYESTIEGTHLGETTTTFPKFYASKGKEVVPYFPRGVTQDLLKDSSTPLFVSEGPIKAISLTAHGFPCIGLGGVEAGYHDVSEAYASGHLMLNEDLKRVEWRGRTVYLVSDAGRQSNPSVARGEAKLAKILREAGANVQLVQLPWAHKDDREHVIFSPADQGPDDYVARHGADDFKKLVAAAVPGNPIEWAMTAKSPTEVDALLGWLPFQAALALAGARGQDGVLATWKRFKTSKKAVTEAVAEYEARIDAGQRKKEPEWQEGLRRNGDGDVTATLANVLHILRKDERLTGRLAFDEFSCTLVWKEPPPWKTSDKAVTDPDATAFTEFLEREFNLVVKTSMSVEAINRVADENAYHPVREYLNNLTWDQTSRLDTWLCDYLGVEDTVYTRAVASKWMIGAIARIMSPGCKMDTALILEGGQGKQKSTALNTLAGEDWFLDDLRDIGSKDACDQLYGCWIVEMGELAALSRGDVETIKRFLTTKKDTYRQAYGRFKRTRRRQNAFSGSTNQDEYLKDETGNRRFLPVKVGKIDVAGLAAMRDQLWAEALHRYRAGEKWWFTEDESEIIEMALAAQEARRQAHPWEALLRSELEGQFCTTVGTVLEDILHLPKAQWNQAAQNQVAKCFRALQWERQQRRIAGTDEREWVYVRAGYRVTSDGSIVGPDGSVVTPAPKSGPRSDVGMCKDDDNISAEELTQIMSRRISARLVKYLLRADTEGASMAYLCTEDGERLAPPCAADTLRTLLGEDAETDVWGDADVGVKVTLDDNGQVVGIAKETLN